jgi:hypothetical protein
MQTEKSIYNAAHHEYYSHQWSSVVINGRHQTVKIPLSQDLSGYQHAQTPTAEPLRSSSKTT